MSAANPASEPSTESLSLPAPQAGAVEKTTRAKTRFTAGAPDLLTALVEAERFFDGSDDHGCPLHRKILAAIDTVKGSPS
ncbi:hypothetical protein ELH53_04045 [Rhizobium ruizarguesonis]|uniref:hypothetical protein n=1 Tax=Rhizobium ruizarguesonis TaxID=2081791 RepID=UPI001032283E|nr:hypothetical protein [Rhizobium ruizarguesonis]TBA84251.1 hypothetical protein ELH53_04045 [Rhizobium ruizarguesonis]TBB10378.1 hypothetical protein ELH50_04300 [Rhizobium ruizarguesonis]TBC28403.1 hypothetical protein ELH35_04110 [Rhizobium ruizarguesonis]